jgi:uncharacterized membrane protein YbhN (UPF0104 family)
MRAKVIRIVQWVFAVLVVTYAGTALHGQWEEIRGRLTSLDIHWGSLAGASGMVLIAFAVLIETWRRVLAAWDSRFGWPTAARIWFASSLGKYIPGNIWAIAAMGMLARQRGASAVAAAGSSILVTVINLASGVAVVLVFAAKLIPHALVAAVVAGVVIAGALAAPLFLPKLVALATKIAGRDVRIPTVPPSTVWWALLGTTFAWVVYGAAFRLFAVALLGDSAVHGGFVLYVAAYTAAYIVGFITPVPAGIGVREFGIIEGLTLLGLTTQSDAAIIAVISRLWLTVLDVIPGLVALAAGHTRTRTRPA